MVNGLFPTPAVADVSRQGRTFAVFTWLPPNSGGSSGGKDKALWAATDHALVPQEQQQSPAFVCQTVQRTEGRTEANRLQGSILGWKNLRQNLQESSSHDAEVSLSTISLSQID